MGVRDGRHYRERRCSTQHLGLAKRRPLASRLRARFADVFAAMQRAASRCISIAGLTEVTAGSLTAFALGKTGLGVG